MRTITDEVGSGAIELTLVTESGHVTHWSTRERAPAKHSELEPGADDRIASKKEQAEEEFSAFYRRPSVAHGDPDNTRVRFGDDGPAGGYERRLSNASCQSAFAISGKEARGWLAMSRATRGTLMRGDLANGYAQTALLRFRRDYSIANLDPWALESPAGSIFENKDQDTSVVDLCGETEWDEDGTSPSGRTGTPDGFHVEQYLRVEADPDELASMDPTAFRRMPKRKLRQRFYGQRGPRDKRSKDLKYRTAITLQGRVHPRGRGPAFDPNHEELLAESRTSAIRVMTFVRRHMRKSLFEVMMEIACHNSTMREVGELAGFRGKQAEAVGQDRARSALWCAINAYAAFDRERERVAVA